MTTEFLIYLAKVALSILLLMGLFKLALAADHSFARNRFYLMGAVIWSVLVPLLTMQWSSQPVAIITPTYIINLPEVVVTAHGTSAPGISWGSTSSILLTIYLTGIAIFLLRMIGSYVRVLYIIATAKNYTIDSYNMKVTRAAIAPFAFFGWIVFPEKFIDHRDLTKMLLHERVHSRQLHSFDLLLGELFAVFQWFNPASWMLKRLITENHEYAADRAVIDLGVSTYEYQALLVNATVGREVVPVNHFSLILIKKRIKMMNKISKSGWLSIKSLLIPVAFVAALVLTSFTVELGVNHTTDNNNAASLATFQKQPSKVKVTPVVKKDDGKQVYDVVEQMPTYPGGTKGMIDFLGKNTKYPEDAIKKDIQGTVYVQFIVEKDGSVSNIKVIRGVHPSLDAEAIRVTKLMENWTPGKQNGKPVSVRFTMPVKFRLDGDKKTSTNENNTTVKVGTSGIKISGDYPDNIVFIINGKESTKEEANKIDPDKIKSINVIKTSSEVAKYGDKSKNGIIEITLKEGITEANMQK